MSISTIGSLVAGMAVGMVIVSMVFVPRAASVAETSEWCFKRQYDSLAELRAYATDPFIFVKMNGDKAQLYVRCTP